MFGSTRPRVGLALGSGGARGLSHIGVIKTLLENNIPIDVIAGSSIGAMVGGFYAAGMDIKEIEEIALGTDWKKIVSVLFEPHLKLGLIGGEKVKNFVKSYLGEKKFSDCFIPFAAVATDLQTGEAVILDKGELTAAIRASISIPLVFKPVELEGRMLADGGLSAPVPVDVARSLGADIVIAVNLDRYYFDENAKPGLYNIANGSLGILRHHLALLGMASADVVIDISLGKDYWYEFTKGQDKISAGEAAVKAALPKLRSVIRAKSQTGLKKYLPFFR